MRRLQFFVIFLITLPPVLSYWLHGTTTYQAVSIGVSEVNSISIGPSILTLTVQDYIPGTDTISNGGTATATFALTSNAATGRVVRVAADSGLNSLPNGVKIFISANLGNGVIQSGSAQVSSNVQLGTTSQILISGLVKVRIPNGTINYRLEAPASAGAFTANYVQVTYFITNS